MPQNEDQKKSEVDAFIRDRIDSVPHMEALLLLWNDRPQGRTVEEMAGALFVARELARRILQDLARQGLLEPAPGQPERYSYAKGPEAQNALMACVDEAYRRDLVRLTRMIHAKGPQSVREFARAFRFTKDKEKE
jgi:DNA-binding MarR family transcriptional regulator